MQENDKTAEKIQKTQKILTEVHNTEKSYHHQLEIAIKAIDAIIEKGFNPKDIGNVNKTTLFLIKNQLEIMKEECVKIEKSFEEVGNFTKDASFLDQYSRLLKTLQASIEHLHHLNIYATYANSFHIMTAVTNDNNKKYKEFEETMVAGNVFENTGLKLAGFTITPVQRGTRYLILP